MQIVTMEDIDNGVSSIIAGTNVTVSPPSGTGDVTVNASGGGGGGPVIANPPVTLTSAQIKALDLTPVTIVAAPGANKQIIPILIRVGFTFGTTAYTTPLSLTRLEWFYNTANASNIFARYNDSASVNPLFLATASRRTQTPVMLGTSLGSWAVPSGGIFNTTVAPSVVVNQPIVLGMVPVAGQTVTYNTGPITTMTVAVAGLGYAVNDTFNIDPADLFDDTNDATGHVTSIGAGGAVTGVAINTPGFSYPITTANPKTGPYPTVHTSGAGNDALTVNVTGATVGDGTGVVEVWYTIAASP